MGLIRAASIVSDGSDLLLKTPAIYQQVFKGQKFIFHRSQRRSYLSSSGRGCSIKRFEGQNDTPVHEWPSPACPPPPPVPLAAVPPAPAPVPLAAVPPAPAPRCPSLHPSPPCSSSPQDCIASPAPARCPSPPSPLPLPPPPVPLVASVTPVLLLPQDCIASAVPHALCPPAPCVVSRPGAPPPGAASPAARTNPAPKRTARSEHSISAFEEPT
nr:vegetative cell wall protein gp1-like [Penaeus vannamei]